MRLFLFLVAGTFLVASRLPAQAPANARDESAVRELVSAYVEAREQRDSTRLASLLAPDADQLVSSGEWRNGLDELVRGMLASSERNTGTRTIEVETVRFIAPGVAIANGRYEIAGAQAGQSRRMWSTFVMTRHNGAWRIQAIRNMLPSRGR